VVAQHKHRTSTRAALAPSQPMSPREAPAGGASGSKWPVVHLSASASAAIDAAAWLTCIRTHACAAPASLHEPDHPC